MPSFPLLKSKRPAQDQENQGFESAAKNRRRHSKRQFLRSLFTRYTGKERKSSSLFEISPASKPAEKAMAPPAANSGSNKPLPAPPSNFKAPSEQRSLGHDLVPETQKETNPALTVPDLHKLFSGAPQFFARSQGHGTGAPHPSVAFPWDAELSIRDLVDHAQIQHGAWSSASAWPHITRKTFSSGEIEQDEIPKAHFSPRCRERPNMLSMQGIERGTIGYQAILELGVADALQEEAALSEEALEELDNRHRKFLHEKDGLRPFCEESLVDGLLAVSSSYHSDAGLPERSTVELYTALFTQILYPPKRVTDLEDPYSLNVQIEALVEVLATPDIWVDFSLVEWRIRLGQVIWGKPDEADLGEDAAIIEQNVRTAETQKFWLLLQILLSCELLLRLDAVAPNIDPLLDAAEMRRFEQMATLGVKWSLILARLWLDNIVVERIALGQLQETKPLIGGWLASFTGTSLEVQATEPPKDRIEHLHFRGKYQARQSSGLLYFARKLHWPDIDMLSELIVTNGINMSNEAPPTPADATPLSVKTQHSSSYFGKLSHRPGFDRGLSKTSQRMSAVIHPAGWLSNSYLSGLILPGESLGHLLISTLLENDNIAVQTLGDEANLYGGFVYRNKSFWSTACIVGRVLAAGKGAAEAMGWISTNVVPEESREGWVNIEAKTISLLGEDGHPRIFNKQAIEYDSSVIGDGDAASIHQEDFVLNVDTRTTKHLDVTFLSLDLFVSGDVDAEETPQAEGSITSALRILTNTAVMSFRIEGGTGSGLGAMKNGEASPREFEVDLKYEVHFVTAHPCVVTSEEAGRDEHPLHRSFGYKTLDLDDVLSFGRGVRLEDILRTKEPARKARVLVIDCPTNPVNESSSPCGNMSQGTAGVKLQKRERGSDMEMLVRALCAERGWNALLSRRGRGCLGCAIREAGALSWGVVVRF